MTLLHALEPRCELGPAVHHVELVGDQEHRLALHARSAAAPSTLASSSPKLAGLDDEQHDVDIGQHALHGAVQRAVQRGAWRVWKPGVSTNTNCASSTVRMPVMRWRVVCALCDVMLTFWPTSAFSSVDLPTFGPADDGQQPQRCAAASGAPSGAVGVGHGGGGARRGVQERSGLPGRSVAFSASSMRRAASCSASRRERPSPVSVGRGPAPRTRSSKVCAWRLPAWC
jgi:hypothetical protein